MKFKPFYPGGRQTNSWCLRFRSCICLSIYEVFSGAMRGLANDVKDM